MTLNASNFCFLGDWGAAEGAAGAETRGPATSSTLGPSSSSSSASAALGLLFQLIKKSRRGISELVERREALGGGKNDEPFDVSRFGIRRRRSLPLVEFGAGRSFRVTRGKLSGCLWDDKCKGVH